MAKFYTDEEHDSIIAAIKEAEKETSGEIRLFIEPHCKGEILDRAAFIFQKLGIHDTKHRNGVLLYIAHDDRQFAILGDAGIHAVVEDNFWDNIKEEMKKHFADGKFVQGVITGILQAGEAMKKYFPAGDDDTNELPDEIALGDD